MVYNDLYGSKIQNKLNLAVIDTAFGTTRHGAISEDDIDQQNNVEQVVWSPAPEVQVTVRVTAQKIFPGSPIPLQGFALVWSVSAPFVGTVKEVTAAQTM